MEKKEVANQEKTACLRKKEFLGFFIMEKLMKDKMLKSALQKSIGITYEI